MKIKPNPKPIIKHTPDGEQIEISPYIWGVMHGEPPIYLEDEEKAIELAKKLGWKPRSKEYAPAIQSGSYTEHLHQHPEEVDSILQKHGINPGAIDRIMENGGGTLPGWNGTTKKNSGHKTEA